MSLTLISKSYLVESDSEFGGEEDEFKEAEKFITGNCESTVKRYMSSKWDYDEEETGSNKKSCSSPPDKEPECQPLKNPPSENIRTSDISLDVLNDRELEAASGVQFEKPQLTSANSSSCFGANLGEIADISWRPNQSCQPQKNKNAKISRRTPRQLKRSCFEPAAELQVHTLYKCPYCLLIFATADDLIQHLPSHAKKNSTIPNTGNADSIKSSDSNQLQHRGKLRKPVRNRKVVSVKSLKILKVPKETAFLRSCELKLTRCDQLTSAWKPHGTTGKTLDVNKKSLTKIRGVTKRRSAAVNTRRKMKRIQGDNDHESGEQTNSRVSDRPESEVMDDLELTGSSKSIHHVEGQESDPDIIAKRSCIKGNIAYKCETCFKCFERNEYLKKHTQIHTDIKPYVCSTCYKRFRTSYNLKRHIRLHTGERPYKCPTCSKGFAHSTNLKRHNRTHTGEKPYKCHTCLKSYRDASHLKRHIRSHTDELTYNKSSYNSSKIKYSMYKK